MLIVVEGCDRTGKSSLVEACAGPGDVALHWDKPARRTAVEEYVDPLLWYVPGAGTDVWCDRHYLGEAVWPALFGRDSIMSDADRLCVELFLAQRGALCVLAQRDPDELERACADEPCAGRAAEAQDEFLAQARASTLYWREWRHGRDPARLLAAARRRERWAAARFPREPVETARRAVESRA